MSLEIIGLIIHPFINVAAFLVILSKITKIKHTCFFVAVCFGLEIIIPFIIAFLGHVFSFEISFPSYTLSFFLPLFIVWYFCRVEKIKKINLSYFPSFYVCQLIALLLSFQLLFHLF